VAPPGTVAQPIKPVETSAIVDQRNDQPVTRVDRLLLKLATSLVLLRA